MTRHDTLFQNLRQALKSGNLKSLSRFDADLERLEKRLQGLSKDELKTIASEAKHLDSLLLAARNGAAEGARIFKNITSPRARSGVYGPNMTRASLLGSTSRQTSRF